MPVFLAILVGGVVSDVVWTFFMGVIEWNVDGRV